jgi:hypothetical protein
MAANQTVDPARISNASEIPPAHAQLLKPSARGWVDVYCGTLPGDIDAPPAANELLAIGPNTGGLSNADYVYSKIATLFGTKLPTLDSPSGRDVKALVFVSGSRAGAYGAFHFPSGGAHAQNAVLDLDRIVVDSVESSGSYAQDSGLFASISHARLTAHAHAFRSGTGPHLEVLRSGTGPHSLELFDVIDADDPRLKQASTEQLRMTHGIVAQSIRALTAALEAKSLSAQPPPAQSADLPELSHTELVGELIAANRQVLDLIGRVAEATGARQYLSTALFAAELAESFEQLRKAAAPGKTDGEAVSRVVACKLAPEISLIPGFSSAVAQRWWQDGRKDYVNRDFAKDTDVDANGAGVMFLLFLTDYLGVPLADLIRHMPPVGGAPLGETYVRLLADYPGLGSIAGKDGAAAFAKMTALLSEHALAPDGTLNLPADGNPFPHISGARQGGLFASSAGGALQS